MTTPTQKLDAKIAELAASGITTSSQYAAFLNREAGEENSFRVTEDADFWADLGIQTARDLAVSLNMSNFSDCYKEENGFRPRGWTYDDAMQWMDRHFAEN